MIFNSVTYLSFLSIIVILFWTLPRNPRLWMVFCASLVFYGFWRIEFIPLMLFSTFVDYFVSLKIGKANSQTERKRLLVISLVLNLGLLFYFKYLFFFVDNAIAVFSLFGLEINRPVLNIVLPLGISFYTFQTISYTIDVYRGIIKPEKRFVLYACYVTFFPQLIAGPILRVREVIHQLNVRQRFSITDFGHGVRWILYGLFLKVVLADNIASFVDTGFSLSPDKLGALDVWTLAFLFGFQIYFDFSAYSHIAIGSARLMGLHFPDNFDFPYLAYSPRDFWRRWHISLSSWIRDYLYLPLAGVRFMDRSTEGLAVATENGSSSGKTGSSIALFLTWGLMGLWHGANWTFVLWGLYHAVFIYVYRYFSAFFNGISDNIKKLTGWMLTLPIIMLGWIPFRAKSVGDAFEMWSSIFSIRSYFRLGMRENVYLVTALVLLGVLISYFFKKFNSKSTSTLPVVRAAAETGFFVVIIGLVFIYLRPINQFIYFQF
jgi:alginate O-acetyltransferase complex protein AlgI